MGNHLSRRCSLLSVGRLKGREGGASLNLEDMTLEAAWSESEVMACQEGSCSEIEWVTGRWRSGRLESQEYAIHDILRLFMLTFASGHSVLQCALSGSHPLLVFLALGIMVDILGGFDS